MKHILILPNPIKDPGFDVTSRVARTLAGFGAELTFPAFCAGKIGIGTCTDETPAACDLIVVIGGDGSVLDAAPRAIESDVPLLGINLGKIGYLSEMEPSDTNLLAGLFCGQYRVEQRMLLSLHTETAGTSARLAVNEIVFSHTGAVGLTEICLGDAGGDTVRYRADALILSTPVGSTAYSLSAGGAILSQDMRAIVVTPVCPHSFFNRSLVFSDSEVLRVSVPAGEVMRVCVDGRDMGVVADCCTVRAAEKKLKLLCLKEKHPFKTLFTKMRHISEI